MSDPESLPSAFDLPPEMTVVDATKAAINFLREGYFEAAEQLLRRILEAAPDHPDALHFLGMMLCDLGRGAEGAPMLERSLALVPDLADWHNNYGIVCVRRDALEDAAAAFNRALSLSDGQLVTAHYNLGITERLRGRIGAAEDHFKSALALRPDYAEAHYSYAALLAAQDRYEESLDQLDLARQSESTESIRTLSALGIGYRRVRRYDKAIEIYRRWAAIDPDSPIPAYYLDALGAGEGTPDRAPDDYVATTFDTFATTFDSVLAKLGYRAPQLVADALSQVRPDPDGSLHILDAGAGTGLCGPLLRPWAKRLVAVDLSPKMLTRARDRDCYDALDCAELTAYLQDHPGRFDVIVSADTLCYFGALSEVLTAAFLSLHPGGHLIFSVEEDHSGAAAEGFVLQPHGRYAHDAARLRRDLDDIGFTALEFTPATLRSEGAEEVRGLIVTAQRPRAQ